MRPTRKNKARRIAQKPAFHSIPGLSLPRLIDKRLQVAIGSTKTWGACSRIFTLYICTRRLDLRRATPLNGGMGFAPAIFPLSEAFDRAPQAERSWRVRSADAT